MGRRRVRDMIVGESAAGARALPRLKSFVVELTACLAAETGMEVGDQLAITPLEEEPR